MPCTKTRLASQSGQSVDACDCGIVHLTVGPATLRLKPQSIRSMAQLLVEAVRQMDSLDAQKAVLNVMPDPDEMPYS